MDGGPIIDIGEIAKIDKTKINKAPVKFQSNFGNTMHVDIEYRCNTYIGGLKYVLFIVDCASYYKFIYQIKSLKN